MTRTGTEAEAKLLARAKAGDRRALEQLLARQQPRIWRFSMKMCGSPDDAGEILQETLLVAARSLRSFRGTASVSTWLYAIARSFCIKRRRRSKAFESPEGSLDSERAHPAARLPDLRPGPEESLSNLQLNAAVERAIRSLDPKYREVLLLRDVEGLTAPEAARVLGLTLQATKSRLHRARVAVREALAPAMGFEQRRPGAGCPDVLALFSRYLEDDIDPALCARMQAHVEACESCRGACESLQKALCVCRAQPTPKVPEDVQASVREALAAALSAPVAKTPKAKSAR